MRAHAYALGLTHHPDEDLMKNKNLHVHCPAGAVPKVSGGETLPSGYPQAVDRYRSS